MKLERLFCTTMLVVCLSVAAGAKKMNLLNPDKGQIFNTTNGCEVSLTEEHAKKGETMIKVDLGGGGWWAGIENPKSFKGFDLMKFRLFNADKAPIKLAFHVKFNDYSCPWEKRFVYDFMAKPGENEIEIEILGATTVDGTPIDWGTKIIAGSFTGEAKKCTLYFGKITLETSEDSDKDGKDGKKQ